MDELEIRFVEEDNRKANQSSQERSAVHKRWSWTRALLIGLSFAVLLFLLLILIIGVNKLSQTNKTLSAAVGTNAARVDVMTTSISKLSHVQATQAAIISTGSPPLATATSLPNLSQVTPIITFPPAISLTNTPTTSLTSTPMITLTSTPTYVLTDTPIISPTLESVAKTPKPQTLKSCQKS